MTGNQPNREKLTDRQKSFIRTEDVIFHLSGLARKYQSALEARLDVSAGAARAVCTVAIESEKPLMVVKRDEVVGALGTEALQFAVVKLELAANSFVPASLVTVGHEQYIGNDKRLFPNTMDDFTSTDLRNVMRFEHTAAVILGIQTELDNADYHLLI